MGEAALRYFFQVESCLDSDVDSLENEQGHNFNLTVTVVALSVLLAISLAGHIRSYLIQQKREAHFTSLLRSNSQRCAPARETVNVRPLGRVELGDPIGQSASFHSCID